MHAEPAPTIGGSIRTRRKAKGPTQADMAEALDMHLTNYSRLENGHSQVSATRLKKIAEILDTSATALMAAIEEGTGVLPEAMEAEALNDLAARVRSRLTILGLGPVEAATSGGLERTLLHDLVTGRKERLQSDTLAKVADVLLCSTDWLLGRDVAAPAPTVAAPSRDFVGIGKRVKAIRVALGLTATQFARLTGLTPQALSNYETGLRRPDIDAAVQIAAASGATLDWIYLGDPSGLPMRIASKMAGELGE